MSVHLPVMIRLQICRFCCCYSQHHAASTLQPRHMQAFGQYSCHLLCYADVFDKSQQIGIHSHGVCACKHGIHTATGICSPVWSSFCLLRAADVPKPSSMLPSSAGRSTAAAARVCSRGELTSVSRSGIASLSTSSADKLLGWYGKLASAVSTGAAG